MRTSISKLISAGRDNFRVIILSGLLISAVSNPASSQCTLTGVSGSGFIFASFCAPAYTSLYYEFTFGTTAPPMPTYIVKFFWGDGSPVQSVGGTVQTKIVGPLTVYYLRVEKDHTFPVGGLCEYSVNMVLYDELNNPCPDSRQVQIIANWHEDDVASASGVIALNPTPRWDVCEGLPFENRFSDASVFACNLQQYPTAQKPNHTARNQQYVYGTNPVAGRGIPNLFIKVGTLQTLVRLTDGSGNPVPNSWTVNPTTGAAVAPYSTVSGYFEGPVSTINVDATTGTYTKPQTYPILFDGVGTVYQDQFQITLRNWNICNPWDGSQTNPNSGIANIATALIYIVDGPLANAGPDASICSNATYNMNGILVDGTSALWTTTGNGSFANATSPDNAIYTPGSADISAGYVDLVLHAYGTGMCPEHTDIMRLSLEPIPAIPTITINAGSNNFCDDNSTSITLRSSVSPNGNYLWKRNGVSTGITTRDITLNDYTQSGNYTVTVYGTTANVCPRESNPLTVNIYQTATVTTQPSNTSTCHDDNMTNGNAAFTVATGGGAHSIRWQRQIGAGAWVDITGTTTPNDGCDYSNYTGLTLSIASAEIGMDGYHYRVKLTTTSGSCITYSNSATLTVYPVPAFTGPDNTSVCELDATSFSSIVTVSSGSISSYYWQRYSSSWTNVDGSIDGGIYSNYTTNTLNISSAPYSINGYDYRLIATTDHGCSRRSGQAEITVRPLADITAHPSNTGVCLGLNTSFTVSDDGNPAVTSRQWQRYNGTTWTNITGAATPNDGCTYGGYTSSTLTLSGVPSGMNNYQFRCILTTTGPCTITSNAGTLTVYNLATTTNPGNTSVCHGQNTSFAITPGGAPRTIQWQRSSNGGGSWVNITGATTPNDGCTYSNYTTATLGITNAQNSMNNYQYRAVLTTTTGGCITTSAAAVLTVNPLPVPTISGPSSVCIGSTGNVYTTEAGMTNYIWTVSAGGTITAGGGAANNTVTVTWNTAGARTVSVNYTNGNGCTAASPTVYNVTVGNPPSAATLTGSGDACYGASSYLRVNITGGAPPYTLVITGYSGSPVNNYTSGTDINLTPPALSVGPHAYTLTTVTDACGSSISPASAYTITINDNPDISATTPASQNICSGSAANITLNTTVSNTIFNYTVSSSPAGGYSWSSAPVNGTITDSNGDRTELLTRTLTHDYNAAVTVTYTITPTGPGATACPGPSITRTVVVNPMPAITAMTASTCSATAFTVTPANGTNGVVPAGTTYTWAAPTVTGGMTGGAAGTNQANISGNLTNPTNTAQTATYTVTPTSGSCTGATFQVVVTVNPRPAITNMAGSSCSASAFTITPANGTDGIVPAGTTYTWAAPTVTGGLTGGAAGTNQANISGNLTNPTNTAQTATYTVTPTAGSCTGAAFQVVVTINPRPAITNMTGSACSASAFTATPVNVTNGLVPAGTTYTWAAPTVTGGLTGGAAGTNQANISGNLTNPTNTAQTATYTVTPTSGTCTGATFQVVVTVNPRPAITDMTGSACSASAFTITPVNVTNGIVPAGTTYTWAAPTVTGGLTGGAAGTNQANISGNLTNPTNSVQTATYVVTPISGSCSGATFQVVVTINPRPAITNMAASSCSASAFTVTPANVTDGIVPAGTTYTWPAPTVTGGLTGGAAGTNQANISGNLTNPTNTAQTATYTVTPTSGSCTGATFQVVVTINPRPAISNMTASTCNGVAFTVTPVNVTNGLVPAGTTYTWPAPTVTGGMTGGAAGTNQANISGTLINSTSSPQTATYTVTPTSGTCAGSSFTVIVTVNPGPAITNMTSSVCSAEAFTITPVDVTNGTVPSGTTYTWPAPVVTGGLTGGAAGTNQANISGTLTNPTNSAQTATYTVTPTAGSCTGTPFTVIVTVNPRPAINNLTASTCSQIAFTVTPVNVTDGIVPVGVTYSWPVPVVTGGMTGGATGSGAANISGNLINSTNIPQTATYTVTPVVGTCTGATFTVIVTVNPVPAILPMTATICSEQTFTVTPANGVNGVVPAGTTYSWGLPIVTGGITGGATGSGAANISGTLVNPTNLAQTATYTVTPVSGTCTGATFQVVVTVNPLPNTGTITGDAVLCENATNRVYQVPSTGGSTYQWTTPASINRTSPQGMYFIIVDAVPGMAAPGDKLTVVETYTATTGCVGKPVEFPVTVVEVIPGQVVTGPLVVCKGDTGVIYSVPDSPGSTYSWSLPVGAFITTNPNLHEISVTFNMATTGQVSVIETSGGVCTTIHTPINVTVNPLPTVYNLTSPLAYCTGDPGVILSLSGSQVGVNYQLFNSGGADGGPLAGSGAVLQWTNKIAETYHVVATNATTGCVQQMNGIAVPTINFVDGGSIGSDQAVCENNSPAAFASITAGTGGGAITYQWQNSTDGIAFNNIAGATSAIYASGPLAVDTYFRRMTTSTLGTSICTDPSDTIHVTAIIFSPGSIGTDQAVCEGTAPAAAFTSVAASGIGAFTYQWLSSTDGVNYTPIPGATNEVYTSGVLSADTWYKREVTSVYMSKACVEETNAIKVTVINFAPGSIGSDQTICENTAPAAFTSVAASGDGTFVYSWESSPAGAAPWTPLGISTPTYTSPALSTDTYFRRAVTSTLGGQSCTLYSNIIHVTVNTFDPGTIGSPETICEGTAPAAFTSVAPSGDPSATFAFQWQNSTDGVNFSSISGATNATYTSGNLSVDTYFRRQVTATLNGRACIEFTPAILVTVNNLTPGSIGTAQTICEGAIPAALSETGVPTLDGAISYQWQESPDGSTWANVASGGNAATYSPPALIADTWYKRLVTSTLGASTCTEESNVIKITINNFNPGNIAADQTICENTAPAAFTSTAPSGDGTFTYRWFFSTDGATFNQVGGATGQTYSPGLLIQDTWYFREVTSTLGVNTCVERTDTLLVTVNNLNPGAITGDQTICEGTIPSLAFGSTAPAADGAITYEWRQSYDGIVFTAIPSSNVEIYTPPALNADTWYKRAVTSTIGGNACTEETNFIKVTVINFTPGSIASDQTVCEGTAPAPFTSVAASGDGIKSYQWENSTDGITFNTIGGATSATYSSPAISVNTWFRRLSTATAGGTSCTEITDTILVTVIIFDPGTIGNAQTICEGDSPAAFTEVTPASGNGTFTYQWQSSLDDVTFTSITGATNATYTAGSLTQDTYFRRQVTATLNGRSCTEFTPSILVTVNNLTPGSIAGAQTICEGDTPAAFTEAGGATYDGVVTYQWQQSPDNSTWANVAAGGNGSTYAPGALIADTWFKRLVISTIGLNTCTEETNVIKVTVNNFNPGSIAADQTICENISAAPLTSVTPTGDGTFTYKWLSSPDGVAFAQIGGAVSEMYSPGMLSADTWYQRVVTSTLSGKACVDSTNIIKITVNNLDPGSISTDQTICENSDPAAFTSVAPTYDGTVSYMWQSSSDGLNFTDIGVTTETYDSPALTVDTWFRRAVTSTIGLNACTEYTNMVKITVINFTPGSIGSDQTICENTVPAGFTSIAASGDGTKSYQWENSLDGITFNTIAGAINATYTSPALTQDTWFRRLSTATIGLASCTEITDTVRVTVINFDPGSIATAQTICEDSSPAAFTSVDVSGDGVITYQWQASIDGTSFSNITGATNATYTSGPLTSDTWFRRQATSLLNGKQCIEYTPDILVTVNNLTPGSISTNQTICEGTTPAAFTSAPATGDGAITYQWQQSSDNGATWNNVPAGGNVEIYVAPALTADMWYKRLATSTLPGSTCTEESNTIKVTVNNFDPGSIAADQTICENTAPAPLTSMTPTGDGIFSYKWYRSTDGTTFAVIGTAISETYSPSLLTQDTWYYREVTSTLGTNSCVERTDTVLITVNNFTPGVIAGTTTICESTAPPAFTVTTPASSDGGVITYQWQDSPDGISFTDITGATSDTYAPPALTADTWYKRLVTSTLNGNICTEETNILRVTVINFAPGSVGSDQTICENTAPSPFTSVAASGDGVKTYQWESSLDGTAFSTITGATFATYTSPALTQDTWFRRLATATLNTVSCTEISDTIRVTVNNFDPGTISADQTICEGDIPVSFTSVAPSGDGNFTFQWQSSTDGVSFSSISGATAATYAPDALTVDTWFRRQVTSELNSMSCIEYTPSINVTVNNLQPGTIGGAQTICEGSVPAALTSVAATGDGTITYQWQESTDNGVTWANVASGGNGATYAPPALSADTWYKRIATSDLGGKTCPAESNTVKITVVNFDPGSVAADQTICEGTAPAAFTSVSPSGDGSFTYRWFRSTDGTSFAVIGTAVSETYSPGTLTQDTWYYREVTATVGTRSCVENTDTVLVTVNNFVPGSIAADQTICEGEDPAAFTSTTPTGDGSFTYQWYESIDGTVFTIIGGATSETYDPPALSVDTWFRRAVTSTLNGNTCTEETNAVRVWVVNFNPGTIGVDQTICEGTAPATFTGTAPSGDGIFTYSWESSLDSITWVPIGGAASSTYTSPAITADTWFRRTVTATLNGHACSEMTPSVKVTVNNFDPQSIAADQWICEGATPAAFTSVTPTGDGTFTYQWQSSLNGTTFSNITGATSETYTAGSLMADTWYRRQVTSTLNGNTCTEITPSIKVTVNNLTAGSIASAQTICEGDIPAPLTSVTPTYDGTVSYEWQSSLDNITFNTIAGATNETYAPPALTADTWYKRVVTSTLPGVTCSKESNVIKITVNNFVPGSISADQTICEGSAAGGLTSITPTGDGTFGYRWLSSPDGTTYAAIPGAINETYNPGTLVADTWYRREVTSTYAGRACVDTTNSVRVTVINFNQGSISADQTICEGGDPVAFTSITPSGDGVVSYQWKSSTDGVNYLNIAGATSETYDPGVLTQDTWYIRSVSFALNGTTCTKETNAVRVYVNNVNAGTIIADQTICNGADPVAFFSVVHGTGDGAVTWQWQDSPDGVTFTNIAGANLLNYDAPPLSADRWYQRVTSSVLNGVTCSKVTNIIKVTVNTVQGGLIASDQTICYGQTPAPLTSPDNGSGSGTVTYQWMRSNDGVIWNTIAGATLSTYTPGVHYMDTYYKRVLVSILNGVLCQAESNAIKITVNPLPIAILSGGATICPTETAILKVNLPIGTGPFTLNIQGHGVVNNYVSDADIVVSPAATTTYTLLSVTDANGCNVTSPSANIMGSATVTVRLLPVIATSPVDRTLCEYGVTTFGVTISQGTDVTYQWFVDSTGVFVPLTDGGVYYGATTNTLSIFGATRDMNGFRFRADVTGCSTTVTSGTALLTVNTVPEIITQPRDTTICSNTGAAFSVTASGTSVNYQWQVKIGAASFANVVNGGVYSGATTSTLTLTNVPAGYNNYIYKVIVSGACGTPVHSNYVILRVNTPPTVTKQPNPASICDGGGPVYFLANGSGMIDSLRWQVSTDNGVTWNDIHDNAMYSGTTTQQLSMIGVPLSYNNYRYRLGLKAFCATTYTNGAVLTVNSLPSISWASDPLPACGNVAQVINTTITNGSGTWSQFTWTGDVGPLNNYFIQNPTFKSLVGGTYKLYFKVKDTNGCFGQDSVSVVVDAPDATFTQDINMGCTPATVHFTKDITGIASWSWDFGDGTPVNTADANPVHVFTNGTPSTILYRTVRLTVTSAGGCTDSKTALMTVYPAVTATFTASDDTVCSGSQLVFTALPGANLYTWDYGDGVSGPGGSAVQHLYLNAAGTPLTRTVQLVTSSFYGCTDTMALPVVVMPMPVAQFTADSTAENYRPTGNVVRFTDATTPASALWTYSWDFDDGGTAAIQNPPHTFTNIGTFDVIMRVTNGKCSSEVSHPISILPQKPIARFDTVPDGCGPLYIELNNTTSYRDTPGTTFRWDFGDGGASTAENPTYTYFTPGIYKVTLTVYGPGGTSTYFRTVEVYPSPQAYFEVAPQLVYVNDEKVRCFNLTQGADTYLWDFGDGDTSMVKEPFHKYMEEGVYDITLWAYSSNGCSDKYVLSPAVTVEPPGQIRFATVFQPNKTGEEDIDVNDINSENMDRFFYPPIKEKVINYKLQIFNRQGMLIFQSDNINKPWNGYYKGKLCPQGVYVWYVEGKYVNGKPFKQIGDITLLH